MDNNSTDGTRAEVERRGRPPFRRRCATCSRAAGRAKSHAINTGLEASDGAVVVFTDDDVHVDAGLARGRPFSPLDRHGPDIDYTGGPVFPIWETCPRRHGLTRDPGVLWGPLALLDYGPDEFVFEDAAADSARA